MSNDRERERDPSDTPKYSDSRFDPSRYDQVSREGLICIIRRRYYERHEDTVRCSQMTREIAAKDARIAELTKQLELMSSQQVSNATNIQHLLIENIALFTQVTLNAYNVQRQ